VAGPFGVALRKHSLCRMPTKLAPANEGGGGASSESTGDKDPVKAAKLHIIESSGARMRSAHASSLDLGAAGDASGDLRTIATRCARGAKKAPSEAHLPETCENGRALCRPIAPFAGPAKSSVECR
jgi:hypothetical protein